MKFSKFFGLNQSQAQLDFVDIDTNQDMRLFVDPYAIQIKENDFNLSCTDQIKTFFAAVLESLTENDPVRSSELTARLSEPQETFLGFSKEKPRGRGVGRKQADQILAALRNSRAFKTGLLADLAETELFIDGIGPDKISDLTTNVIRSTLIEYTQNQCRLHGIPMMEGIPSGNMWHASKREWHADYIELPMVDDKPVILVPKYLVRWRLSLNSQEFYNHYMLSFMRDVELSSPSSKLVSVLRSKKRVVYKKDLKREYPLIKDELATFVKNHPEMLQQYKKFKGAQGALTNEDMDKDFDERKFAALLADNLSKIPAGIKHASQYHSFMQGILTFLFFPDLINPIKEYEIDDRRKRIDIKFTNAAEHGFFYRIAEQPQTRSMDIFFECKNYSDDLSNPELDQIAGRFSPFRGKLGFILCRTLANEGLMLKRCQDTAKADRGFVIVLTDVKVIRFLRLIQEGQRVKISDALFSELSSLTS
jgi:hypothetical protein